MKRLFKEYELLEKGFELVEDGGSIYLQYIFDKSDYINSRFLATTDRKKYSLTDGQIFYTYRVINSIDPDNGEPYLVESEIDELIKKG